VALASMLLMIGGLTVFWIASDMQVRAIALAVVTVNIAIIIVELRRSRRRR
jgi:hypothetical protein